MIAHRGALRAFLAVAAATALVPARGAALTLMERELTLDGAAPERSLAPDGAGPDLDLATPALSVARAAPDLRVAAAQEPAKDPGAKGGAAKAAGKAAAPAPLDFDLLGDAPAAPAVQEDPSLRTRRKMLNLHQGFGIGLMALQVASTVTGQLNYNDKFSVDNTGRYRATQ